MLKSGFARWGAGAVLWAVASSLAWAQQDEELCAEVKIEILQELTLERQGFEAVMRITNGLDTFALEDVNVEVHFADADGNAVTATSDTNASSAEFFIRVDDSHQVSSIQTGANGQITNGVIAQQAAAEIRWLIIPSGNAAGQTQNGELYFVGATLSYTFGGDEEVINVAPDSIVVKPQPKLSLDYFLTEEVIADDAFTQEIEPPQPYTLGVRVRNNGYGSAGNLQLESAQPTIVENEQGLAIDFSILRSFVEDQPAEPSLLMAFGEIAAQDVVAGRWVMESSLSGKFTQFQASFTHADALGGELTSLLDSTNAYLLEHNVQVDLPGRDSVLDFLAENQGSWYVFESEPTGAGDALCDHCASVTQQGGSLAATGGLIRELTTETVDGLVHVQLSDPFEGGKVLSRVVRSDGKTLKSANVWLSQKRAEDKRSFNYYLNVFDWQPTATYTVYFADAGDVPQAPVIQAINDRTTHETGQIGFLVQAHDANDTIPTLGQSNLPAGASFEDKGNGTGVFSWFPAVGQAGDYSITFTATDGELTAERTVAIKVNPADDTDGDGLRDSWERDYFGDLSRDGSGDSDSDGRTDAEEHDQETDPTVAEIAPGVPEILSPIFNEEILQGSASPLLPTLTVINAEHSQEMLVRYVFEVFADEQFTQLIASALVAEGSSQTAWLISESDLVEGHSFQDNQRYVWRVRSETDEQNPIPSEWATSAFLINTVNDAPTAPIIRTPAQDAIVASVKPLLSVNNSSDVDGDLLHYGFEIFHESDLTTPVSHIANLLPGSEGHTDWTVPVSLIEDGAYVWKAKVTDEHGLSAESVAGAFLVSLQNNAPSTPSLAFPAESSVVTELDANGLTLTVNNAQDPEGQPLQYVFEIDQVNTFDSGALQQSGLIGSSDTQTGWRAENLIENVTYHWRVKATDSLVESDWVQGRFTVNAVNESPSSVQLLNPIQGAVVETLRPLLQVTDSTDPDGDTVSYRYELYRDAEATDLVVSHTDEATQWSANFDLDDNTRYYWRASSLDNTGLSSDWSALELFVTNENGINDAPEFSFVLPAAELTVNSPVVEVQWTDNDPDSSATIELFYRHQGALVSIVSGIAEDLDGEGDRFAWNVSGLLPGSYQLTAEITDGESTISVDACCSVVVPSGEKSLTVTPLTLLETSESGTEVARIEVSLDQPLTDSDELTLNLSLSDSTEATILGNQYLQFTADNWQQPQIIELIGSDDCDIDGDIGYQLIFAAVESSDESYQGVMLDSVSLTNLDNESDGQSLVMCHYRLIAQEPVAGTDLTEFTYKASVLNHGATLQSANAVLSIRPSPKLDRAIQITGDQTLEFSSVLSGASTESNDTFVLRYNPTFALDTGKLQWSFLAGPTGDVTEGNASNNTLIGTEGDDILDGKAGNDTLRGGAGNDTLIGGEGADYLYGESGDDIFVVQGHQNHADRFNGGDGIDRVVGSAGDDGIRVSSFSGSNTVEAIDGVAGSDWIYGTSSNNTLDFRATQLMNIVGIDALAGNDTVYGSASADLIVGGAGSDYLYGDGGDDVFSIEGNDSGFDRVNGGAGTDTVRGSSGVDLFRFSSFSGANTVEVIDGVGGEDWIEGSNSNNTLDFRATQFISIERIRALGGNDTVYGSTGNDVIEGGTGSDYLYGDGGNDQFILTTGDTGYDRYNGGEGEDRVVGSALDDIIRISSFSGANTVEEIDGDGGRNIILGSSSNNTLDFTGTRLVSIERIDAGKGNDTVRGSNSSDLIVGGEGSDYLYGNQGDDVFEVTAKDAGYDRVNGGEGVDRLLGLSGDDDIRLSSFSGDNRVEIIDGAGGVNRIVSSNSNNTLDFRGTQLLNIQSIEALNGNDTVYGSDNADTIVGGLGSDYLYGEGGNDTFILTASDTGYDRVNGGEGTDRLQGTNGNDDIRFSSFSGANTVEVIDGGDGSDRILGSGSNNTLDFRQTALTNIVEIDAGAGNDTVYGSSGNDRILGGVGSDYLFGDAGDDVFVLTPGDTGYDRYNGGDGNDRLEGHDNNDEFRLSSFSGANTVEILDGKTGLNVIVGTTSNNTLDFTNTQLIAIESINAGKGNDTVYGSNAADVIIGGEGSDYLSGNDGDDVFLLSPGDTGYDRYTGGLGNDRVEGGDSDDVIRLSSFSGANTVEEIDGKAGSNVVVGSTSNNTLDFTDTTLVNISRIDGDKGNDTIKGSQGNDVIVGGIGSDYLFGNGGDDRFLVSAGDTGFDRYSGGDGTDVLEGLESDDVIRLSSFSGVNTVERIDGKGGDNRIESSSSNNTLDFSLTELVNIQRIDAGKGNDTVKGSSGSDVIEGGEGSDYLYGNGGNDLFISTPSDVGYNLINGGEGTDTLRGTNADDVLRFSNFSGANTVEVIDGNGGSDIIQGTTGNNTLDFGATQLIGITTLDANKGNDTLRGSVGNDLLIGGVGNDTLSGNNGADVYRFARGDGVDSVEDNGADLAIDTLELTAGIAMEDVWLVRSGNHLVVYLLAGSEKLTLRNNFSEPSDQIERIQLDSGIMLELGAAEAMINAMTEIGIPVGGVVALTSDQQQVIDDYRASGWK